MAVRDDLLQFVLQQCLHCQCGQRGSQAIGNTNVSHLIRCQRNAKTCRGFDLLDVRSGTPLRQMPDQIPSSIPCPLTVASSAEAAGEYDQVQINLCPSVVIGV